jgi:hypothetical protein
MYHEGKDELMSASPDYAAKKEPKRQSIKKDKVSLLPMNTSYTVPFYFADSGRRNQVLICEGRKYIQNNKYGDKVYYKCRYVNFLLKFLPLYLLNIKFFSQQLAFRMQSESHYINVAARLHYSSK